MLWETSVTLIVLGISIIVIGLVGIPIIVIGLVGILSSFTKKNRQIHEVFMNDKEFLEKIKKMTHSEKVEAMVEWQKQEEEVWEECKRLNIDYQDYKNLSTLKASRVIEEDDGIMPCNITGCPLYQYNHASKIKSKAL